MSTLFELPANGNDSAAHAPEQLLTDLNAAQRAAVEHAGSPLLVVAGAGSGKTRVLTRRIAHLLAVRGAAPGQIMAITFTNKAATEMRERVGELVGQRVNAMWVSTFHSMCVRVLRREAATFGISSNFSIYDADDSKRLLNLVTRDLELDTKRYPARSLAGYISNWKNELIGPREAADQAGSDFERTAAEVYEAYQRRLAAANAFDFDDLIMRTVELLRAYPAVAEHYRRRFRHVMVDEYQDTNHAQYVLVREIVGTRTSDSGVEPAELCVVGDADQSIYAFRGATIRNITEFERDFPGARTIVLEQNYRSTQTILSAANAVISQNTSRRDKRLWTAEGTGSKITGYVADNEYDEAAFVAGEIDELVDGGDLGYGDIAVFYRTNNQSRAIEEVFIRFGLPYRIVGGVRFYERREVRDALAYLRLLDNPQDTVSLRRILNVPKRAIGERAEAVVANHAERERISFATALRAAANGEVTELNTRARKAIAGFVELLDGLHELVASGADVAEVLAAVLERTGYRAMLEQSDDLQDASRLDNLTELVTVAREFTDTAESQTAAAEDVDADPDTGVAAPGSLAAFLERVALVADTDSIPAADEEGRQTESEMQDVVTLMTVHSAKGLEYPVVFGIGWEDGVFPHMRSLGQDTELAEERRLAYVALTRARRAVYVTRAVTRSAWGQPMNNPASRFLGEIPTDLVDWRREAEMGEATALPRSAGTWRGSGVGATGAATGSVTSSGSKSWKDTVAMKLDVGDRVSHDKYGLGTVVATEGTGSRATATIDFGATGKVRLMLIGTVPMVKLS